MAKKTTTRPLTYPEGKFCREYILDMDEVRAAGVAGFFLPDDDEKTRRRKARELRERPEIDKRIQTLLDECAADLELSDFNVLARLLSLANKAEAAGKFADAKSCIELIGKAKRMFVDRVEVNDTDRAVALEEARKRATLGK